jgi:hypothetical protein
VILQRKGQEIVDKELANALLKGIDAFKARNEGKAPEHYIVYRDGVGDGQRRQVLDLEVKQMREAILSIQNKAARSPHITLIVVNKRISQRFFIDNGNGDIMNPPSGSIIDTGLVAKEGSDSVFDFYLVPQTTT